jgi:uncharacterized repeat protein (TIGR03803 family)
MLPMSSKCVLGGSLALALLIQISSAHAASQEKVLYSFPGGSDGGDPRASLIADSVGNLYGTTDDGAIYGYGTVFKITTK